MVNRRKDGSLYHEGQTITPVRDGSGQVSEYVAVKQDITERKRTEDELLRAREAAVEASRLKSEFLANMSHEIRTPMNGVLGMVELVLDTELDEEQQECLETARSSAESLLEIINDILDFSKIEARKLDLEVIPFDLRHTLDQMLKPFSMQAERKGIELACRVDKDVPDALMGDPGRVRQVMGNLVGNAIKFTDHGGVKVDVGILSRDERGALLRFAVSDTGIGIPREKKDRMFEAFSQADGSTTRRFGGTGLGLTICRQLVEMMGGTIGVDSEPGRGSTFDFEVRFPVQDLPERSVEPRAAIDPAGRRALVLETDFTNRRVLTGLLLRWGMDVLVARDDAEALRELLKGREENRPFDVAILAGSGFDSAERIRGEKTLATLPMLMLPRNGRRGDSSRCRELGIGAYLLQPTTSTDLREALECVLSRPAGSPGTVVTRHSLREGRRPLRVLLAEDNRVNRTVATRLLEKKGYTVTGVENGREALEQLERALFDLVLMDVQMPEMDGFEATRKLREREHESERRVPVIALTAHAMKGDRERCLDAGMDGYVAKPIRREELFQAIDQALSDGASSP
jgi:signal transduction histidine kinase/CheY-like chemotaxis protein